MPLINEISNAFNRAANSYEKEALIQVEIGNRLIERLEYIKIEPRFILDLGSGTGFFTNKLRSLYPNAHIVSLDLAIEMLKLCQSKLQVNANMHALPFADSSFDLVFANQVVHWSEDMPALFKELYRVMKVDGCLLFSTLGPDSLGEIRDAWGQIDSNMHVNDFADMHDIGDVLLQARLADPVVDMEKIVVHYNSVKSMINALKAQGVRNIHQKRKAGLTGKKLWQQFMESFVQTATGKYPLTYEVVNGHAWKSAVMQENNDLETFIPISAISRA